MPLYEYECDNCQNRFEVIQKYSDAAPPCPKCDGPVHKLASSPAIQFKGSGWYITDYARAGKSDEGKSGSSRGDGSKSESKSESSDSAKTETKSDSAKTESKSDSKTESKSESKPASTPSTS